MFLIRSHYAKYLNAFLVTWLSLCGGALADQPSEFFQAKVGTLSASQPALAAYQGKPVIVNFWARWCQPCREEIPAFNRLQTTHTGKLTILGIGLEEDAAAVQAFAKQYKMNYPVFLGQEAAISMMKALGNVKGGLPYTVAIRANGEIAYRKMGLMRPEDMQQALQALQ